MKTTPLPADFNVITSAEIATAVALVRTCKTGEHAIVFGVEIECVRRGWFQIVGQLKHELRSDGVVGLIARMPSLRRAVAVAP